MALAQARERGRLQLRRTKAGKRARTGQKQSSRLFYVPADSRPKRRTRIAVLNSHPIQYFAPLYAYLNAAPDLEVTALYLSDFSVRGGTDAGFGRPVRWNFDLLAGYRSVFLG